MAESPNLALGYNSTYELFDSPLMQAIRRESYGEDIGQYSWVTAAELREHLQSLKLTEQSRVLDFGCGPCGPLTFIAKNVGCQLVGVDLSAQALAVGAARAKRMEVSSLIELHQADGNSALPVRAGFDAVVSFDVILHLQDRATILKRFSSLLKPSGKILLTDAGVVTGAISNEEFALRSVNGFTQFVPPGFNEKILESCSFKILSITDRTDGLLHNASGRIRARSAHAEELIKIEGPEKFHEQQRYLETVVKLSERKALSRMVYLAEWSTR